jgi:hypothetical protein
LIGIQEEVLDYWVQHKNVEMINHFMNTVRFVSG